MAQAGAGRDVTLHRLRRGRAVGPNLTLETPSEKSHVSLDAPPGQHSLDILERVLGDRWGRLRRRR